MTTSPDGGTLYSANGETRDGNGATLQKALLSVVDTSLNKVVRTIELPAGALNNPINPRMMAVTPDGLKLYINMFAL